MTEENDEANISFIKNAAAPLFHSYLPSKLAMLLINFKCQISEIKHSLCFILHVKVLAT